MKASIVWIAALLAGCAGAWPAEPFPRPLAVETVSLERALGSYSMGAAAADGAWSDCIADKVAQGVGEDEPAVSVAKTVLAACQDEEAATVRALRPSVGELAPDLVRTARAYRGGMLAKLVREMRADPGDRHALTAWGLCIGKAARDRVDGSLSPEAIAAEMFEACWMEDLLAYASISREAGPAFASRAMTAARASAHDQAMTLVAKSRATSTP